MSDPIQEFYKRLKVVVLNPYGGPVEVRAWPSQEDFGLSSKSHKEQHRTMNSGEFSHLPSFVFKPGVTIHEYNTIKPVLLVDHFFESGDCRLEASLKQPKRCYVLACFTPNEPVMEEFEPHQRLPIIRATFGEYELGLYRESKKLSEQEKTAIDTQRKKLTREVFGARHERKRNPGFQLDKANEIVYPLWPSCRSKNEEPEHTEVEVR